MRPWLAVFLCALLFLQPGWAATTSPEVRGGDPVAAVHPCPHAHPCGAQAAGASTDADHSDCGICHNSCAAALPGTQALGVAVRVAFPLPGATPAPASHPAELPERPQWAAPAEV